MTLSCMLECLVEVQKQGCLKDELIEDNCDISYSVMAILGWELSLHLVIASILSHSSNSLVREDWINLVNGQQLLYI